MRGWRQLAQSGKWIAAAAAVLLLVGTQIVVQRTHKTPSACFVSVLWLF